MSMYTLLRNHPTPTPQQLMTAFDGKMSTYEESDSPLADRRRKTPSTACSTATSGYFSFGEHKKNVACEKRVTTLEVVVPQIVTHETRFLK